MAGASPPAGGSAQQVPNFLDRTLRVFGEVRVGEGTTTVLMFLNIFFLLTAYYVLKTVREPLILSGGGAELKSYAAAAQALVLIGYVPLYAWLASRLPRQKLIVTLIVFFVVCIQLFALLHGMGMPYIGFFFFVWLGIFSVSMVALFWSYANDIHDEASGKRLFPLIAVGATAGAPIGAKVAADLYDLGVSSSWMMHLAAVLLLVHLFLYLIVNRRVTAPDTQQGATGSLDAVRGGGGFSLVFRSRYLMLIAALLVLLNIVNTTGEYILSRSVIEHAEALADAAAEFDRDAFIGSFYGNFFFAVNVVAILLQAFVVSRLVKYWGMRGALLVLPIIALGTYSLVAVGAGFAILRVTKMAENATDYSLMNTAKQMLWLPTSREEKYKAKQAVDTFFVRAGDVLSAALVFVGTQWIALDIMGFGAANVVFVVLWLVIAFWLMREYQRKHGN